MNVMDGRTEMTEGERGGEEGNEQKNLLLLEFSLQPSEAGGIKVKMLERQEGGNETRRSCISGVGCSANINILSHINTASTSSCCSEL